MNEFFPLCKNLLEFAQHNWRVHYSVQCFLSLAGSSSVFTASLQRNVNHTLIKVASFFYAAIQNLACSWPSLHAPLDLTPRCYPALCKHDPGFALRDVQSHIRWFLCFQAHRSEQEFLPKLSSLCLKQRKALCHYPSLTENTRRTLNWLQVLIAQYASTACYFFPGRPFAWPRYVQWC